MLFQHQWRRKQVCNNTEANTNSSRHGKTSNSRHPKRNREEILQSEACICQEVVPYHTRQFETTEETNTKIDYYDIETALEPAYIARARPFLLFMSKRTMPVPLNASLKPKSTFHSSNETGVTAARIEARRLPCGTSKPTSIPAYTTAEHMLCPSIPAYTTAEHMLC